jgi:pyruvate,water dikinase
VSTTYLQPATIWTRRIANELWSGPVTPLTYSLLAEPMSEHLVRRPLRVAGLDALAVLPALRCHASHVYVNATLLAAAIRLLPGGLLSAGLLDLLPATARAEIGAGSSWLQGGTRAVAIALRAWLNEPSWAPWERATAFERECVRVRREFENRGPFGVKLPTPGLHAELRRVQGRLGAYLDVVSWGVVFAYVFYHLLHELCRHWAPGLEDERAALTVGLPGIASLEAHQELRSLGSRLAGDGVRSEAALAGVRGPTAAAFEEFLARHGHRLTGRDLSCPTWRESPAMVIELADSGSGTAFDPIVAARRRSEATAAIERVLGSGPGGAVRRAAFHFVLASAQRYYALRENMRYHADFFLARMRDLALALGADLAARGRLGTADDVFWLAADELERADTGEDLLGVRAGERRRAAADDARHPPPETLDDGQPARRDPLAVASVLRGSVGAPGRRRGIARLVGNPADFPRVDAGDILVAVYTDPGWTPVLERAAGLVLEAGGLLSHGAIVARELGIPALVDVADATRLLHDGDTIEIDTSVGVVTVLAPAADRSA